MTQTRSFCLLLAALCFLTLANCHNWLVNPVSRGDQRDTQTGCRYGGEGNPTCAGPCDRKISQMTIAPITVQRGQALDIEWNRHNHPGGFIRFAWSPTSQSDSHASFDQYVDHFVCKDSGGCGPVSASDPTGTPNGLNCAASITVPTWVTNGAWTLQWAYFGGYYNAGDYYACVDYVVSGGPTGVQTAPYFNGGDATFPNQQKCLFYSTNALHVCTVEPCLNGTFPPGNQAGAPLLNSNLPPTPPPAPTPTPPPAPATTRAATTRAATTHAVTSAKITSGQAIPQTVTTKRATTHAVNQPATTSKLTTGMVVSQPPPSPPPTPVPTPVATTSKSTTGTIPVTPPPSNNPCTLGEQKCTSENTYQTCSWATNTMTGWSSNQNCPATLSCNPHPVYPGYIWCY